MALKKLLLAALIFVLLFGGFFIYLKAVPPLLTGTIVKSEDGQTVVIALGNKGFRDLKVTGVKVNNYADPADLKMQVGQSSEDLMATIEEDPGDGKSIEFKNVEDVSIPKGTNPEERQEKVYGLTVNHQEPIHNVHIKYRYFGILFNDTIILD